MVFYLKSIGRTFGILGAALMVVGLGVCLVRPKNRAIGLTCLIAVTSFIAFYVVQSIRHERYLVPAYPFLAVLYAFGVLAVAKKFDKSLVAKFLIVAFCAACEALLFKSETKYEHGTGWPSFSDPATKDTLVFLEDRSFGMARVKGRAFSSPLARGLYPRASTAEVDPRAKPGAPSAVEVRCAYCGAHLGHVFDDGPAPTGRHYCINSAALTFKKTGTERTEKSTSAPAAAGLSGFAVPMTAETAIATFAAGCFWGVEDKFSKLPGVVETVVGYTGGHTKNPSYRDVCSDETGHAESVRVTFIPSLIAYEDLVRAFFTFHDPTQLNRQGPDVGTQYRSVIFYHSEDQKAKAQAVKAEFDASGRFRKNIVTEIVPSSEFTKAEEYHQKYVQKKEGG